MCGKSSQRERRSAAVSRILTRVRRTLSTSATEHRRVAAEPLVPGRDAAGHAALADSAALRDRRDRGRGWPWSARRSRASTCRSTTSRAAACRVRDEQRRASRCGCRAAGRCRAWSRRLSLALDIALLTRAARAHRRPVQPVQRGLRRAGRARGAHAGLALGLAARRARRGVLRRRSSTGTRTSSSRPSPAQRLPDPSVHDLDRRRRRRRSWSRYFVVQASAALVRREARARSHAGARPHAPSGSSSLTTLAAGAAHELSTPLATIALASRELEHAAAARGSVPDLAEDARLIRARSIAAAPSSIR